MTKMRKDVLKWQKFQKFFKISKRSNATRMYLYNIFTSLKRLGGCKKKWKKSVDGGKKLHFPLRRWQEHLFIETARFIL